jgi:hypothetical protein
LSAWLSVQLCAGTHSRDTRNAFDAMPLGTMTGSFGGQIDFPRNGQRRPAFIPYVGSTRWTMDVNPGKHWSEMDFAELKASLHYGNMFVETASMLCRDEDEVRRVSIIHRQNKA